MLGWIRRLLTTDTLATTTELQELRKENREMRLLLAKALKVSQELSLKQQESIDRVIAKQFDPPVQVTSSYEQPGPKLVMPAIHLSDVMGMEDDREFLEAVHVS